MTLSARETAALAAIDQRWPRTWRNKARQLASLLATATPQRLATVVAAVPAANPDALLVYDGNANRQAIQRGLRDGTLTAAASGAELHRFILGEAGDSVSQFRSTDSED